jgi:hypothetical protein
MYYMQKPHYDSENTEMKTFFGDYKCLDFDGDRMSLGRGRPEPQNRKEANS